jgi:hypothetical protein
MHARPPVDGNAQQPFRSSVPGDRSLCSTLVRRSWQRFRGYPDAGARALVAMPSIACLCTMARKAAPQHRIAKHLVRGTRPRPAAGGDGDARSPRSRFLCLSALYPNFDG